MFHVLQDPVIGNGQKNQTFWVRIATHHNNNRPLCCAKHLAKSLETKWGAIKHDVAKFCDNYQTVVALNKCSESSKHTLQKALKLFKAKHPKQGFAKIHFWLIL